MMLSRRSIIVLRRLLLGLACLGTLVALIVVVENWRGDRAWAAVEADVRARGESLELGAFQPRPVPDHQNFFKSPVLAQILYFLPDDPAQKKLLAAMRLSDFQALGRFQANANDFASLRDALQAKGLVASVSHSPAADVIQAMAPLFPVFDDIRAAAQSRPLAALESRVHPFDPPHVAAGTLFQLGQAFSVRAAAQLELGRVDEAYADLIAVQRLANEIAAPPATLLMVMVGHALQGIAAGAISDGCERRLWSDAQLADFQQRQRRFDPLARFAAAMRCERAAFVHILETRPKLMAEEFQFPPWLFFHGWAQQNKVAYCRRLDAEVFAAIGTSPERVFPERLRASSTQPGSRAKSKHPYDRLASIALYNVGRILEQFGTRAEQFRLHAITWAMERYRLKHDHFPENLEDLTPDFVSDIPVGILDGAVLRYERQPDGRPRVYANGKNGADDGGKGDDIVVKNPTGS